MTKATLLLCLLAACKPVHPSPELREQDFAKAESHWLRYCKALGVHGQCMRASYPNESILVCTVNHNGLLESVDCRANGCRLN